MSSPTMPPVHVDQTKIHEFENAEAFYTWLAKNHDRETELWIKIHKVNSGLKSITTKESIDVVLCWGWIDAIKKSFDQSSFLQRYTRRGAKSIWSKINVDNVERLVIEGRMTEHGLKHVAAAKADGRWQRAYASGKNLKVPDDFLSALENEPQAKNFFVKLSEQNRFAIAFRLHNLKTEKARQTNIEKYVSMLSREETIYPQSNK